MRLFSHPRAFCRLPVLLPLITLGGALLLPPAARAQNGLRGWQGYGGGPQHTGLATVPAQALRRIRWSTPVDLNPQYRGSALLIHYGSPLVTRSNTVVVTVKVGTTDGFRMEGRKASDGSLRWTMDTDYTLPPHRWTPSCGPTLTPYNSLVVPGAGGTVYRRLSADMPASIVKQFAFYGLGNYAANPDAYNANVKINTPITSDSHGNLYFGFMVLGDTPLHLQSGIARISISGFGAWVAATKAAGDGSITKVAHNCAPALSSDGKTLYVAVNSGDGTRGSGGYLLALNSKTLAPLAKVRLKEPLANNDASVNDNGTASPMVGPDGDVYYGVLDNPSGSNHFRGWMLHFDSNLSLQKTPGAFGWDNTPSVVPAAAVPSYAGASPYLLLTKYNHYAGAGGDGVNKVAVLDPNTAMTDPVSGVAVMKEILTAVGPTPDTEFRDRGFPDAVREWCINTAAVDPFTKCALVGCEDGILYRWDFTTNTLAQAVRLTPGIGEAYTPTVLGPDGIVYAINNARLFAVGNPLLAGRVWDSSRKPIEGAEVHLWSLDRQMFLPNIATTGADGKYRFSLADIPAGRYHVGAYKEATNGRVTSPGSAGWEVTDTTNDLWPADVVLHKVGPLAALFGNARYEDATGAHSIGEGCHIEVYNGGRLVATADTAADGSYRIEALQTIPKSYGWYTFIATWEGHKTSGVNFIVRSSRPTRMDIVFKL